MLSQSKIYAPHKSRGSDFFYGDAGVVSALDDLQKWQYIFINKNFYFFLNKT
jgi:hypothetical protein